MKRIDFINNFPKRLLSRKSDFNISVVVSVRNRTKNVRNRTLFRTLYFRLFSHYQAIIILARFLLYNKYTNEQKLYL